MASLGAVRSGTGPTVVFLHGFTQTARSAPAFVDALATHREVICMDLPGHGESSDISADLEDAAQLVVEATSGATFDLVGYSLGGRVALHVVAAAPSGLRRAVTISASPGIQDPERRDERLARDRSLADDLARSGDVAAFVERWLAAPMFATLDPARADAAERVGNTADGLADSLRRCSLGAQRWLGGELATTSVPTLMLAGARDDPFVASACSIAAASASVVAAAVVGSGHACHLEQPELTARLVDSFLAR